MLIETLIESLKIILIVFVLMVFVEFMELRYRDKIKRYLTNKPLIQYVVASFLGIIPGCMDAFIVVSLYISGVVGFGALTAVMIATAGDEAFVMLTVIPKTALKLFLICFFIGIGGGFIADKLVKRLNIKLSKKCRVEFHAEEEKFRLKHFVKEHVYAHIIKKHLLKLSAWLFSTILIINYVMSYFNLEQILPENKLLLLFIAALIGILPESGPHLIFVMLYSKNLIPFSVLLTSSIVQDGHGILPLLSYTIRDSVKVKLFNFLFGLIIGLIFLLFGF